MLCATALMAQDNTAPAPKTASGPAAKLREDLATAVKNGNLTEGQKMNAGRDQTVRGIAFDGGYGITEVLFSEDGGKTWRETQLGKDLGKYSFREWTIPFKPQRAGPYELKVKATNRIGQSQPTEALWNPPGYMRNVVETVKVSVA